MPATMQRRWWAGFLLLFFFFKMGIERIQRDKSNETLVSHKHGAIKMDTNLHNAYAWGMHSRVGKHVKN